MPEVPELNLVGLTLQKHFKGQRIEAIEILWPKRIKNTQEEFSSAIVGGKLLGVSRNGKELHLALDNGHTLGIHMMLTGSMHLLLDTVEVKWPIFKLWFEHEKGIVVADGLGGAKPILDPEISKIPDIMDKAFTLDYFKKILAKKSKQIKPVILDQNVVRGIGNAYADEILWHAKISPFSQANAIPEERIEQLYRSIKEITKDATEALEKTKPRDDLFVMENYDHRFIHNPKKDLSPDGKPIIKGKVGSGKTYYTEDQELFEAPKK